MDITAVWGWGRRIQNIELELATLRLLIAATCMFSLWWAVIRDSRFDEHSAIISLTGLTAWFAAAVRNRRFLQGMAGTKRYPARARHPCRCWGSDIRAFPNG